MEIKLGLNKSKLEQYADYMIGILHGDFGTSYVYNRPVTSLIAERIPNTLVITLTSLVIAICSEATARLIKTPVILLLVPMLIPEIPGGDLYYTMYSLIEGDSAKFASLLQLVLAEAGAIALGIILASYAAGLINNIYRHVRPCAHSPHK